MIAIVTLVSVLAQVSDTEPYPGRHTEDIAASRPIRQEQFDQIRRYAERLKERSDEQRSGVWDFDYSSEAAYTESLGPLRRHIHERIGFPPPLPKADAEPRFERVASDAFADVYRMYREVLEGVEVYGILSIPHGLTEPAPLLICQHGGGGSPEIIVPFEKSTANYGWMVQRALQEGYVTWSPGLIFRIGGNEEIKGPDRQELDKMLRNVGTSILAVELYKLQRGLDAVLERPEVDPERVGMMGLSYGGLYTQYATALDPRIRVGVSSCFFNDRKLYSRDDWSFFNYLNEFTDAEVCALICPRPLMIEVGVNDALFNIEGARSQVEAAGRPWRELGLEDRFVYVEFDGGHEFRGDGAYDFVRPHLRPERGPR